MSDRKILNRNYTYYLDSANNSEWVYLNNFLTVDECNSIINIGNSHPRIMSYVNETNDIQHNIRRNHVVFLQSADHTNDWIFAKLAATVKSLNQQFWNFDLKFLETLQFTIYDEPGDFYTAHMDMGHNRVESRKLSIVVQLSNPNDYEGSNLQLHSCGTDFYNTSREQGTLIAFPSYKVHQVTPLIAGTRYSLVSWVCGPPLK